MNNFLVFESLISHPIPQQQHPPNSFQHQQPQQNPASPQILNLLSGPPPVNDCVNPFSHPWIDPLISVAASSVANCDPRYKRCTLNAIPSSIALLGKCKVPLGLLVTPYRCLLEGEVKRQKEENTFILYSQLYSLHSLSFSPIRILCPLLIQKQLSGVDVAGRILTHGSSLQSLILDGSATFVICRMRVSMPREEREKYRSRVAISHSTHHSLPVSVDLPFLLSPQLL